MRGPTLTMTLRRIVRLRCPACGRGRVFRRPFLRRERCERCGWRFEREEGHWVGGSEVHMFASYGISVLFCIPCLLLFGFTPPVVTGVLLGHVIVSLAAFHYSRAVFLGIDYFLDPAPPSRADDGDDDGTREPLPPKPPPGRTRRPPRARELVHH